MGKTRSLFSDSHYAEHATGSIITFAFCPIGSVGRAANVPPMQCHASPLLMLSLFHGRMVVPDDQVKFVHIHVSVGK